MSILFLYVVDKNPEAFVVVVVLHLENSNKLLAVVKKCGFVRCSDMEVHQPPHIFTSQQQHLPIQRLITEYTR